MVWCVWCVCESELLCALQFRNLSLLPVVFLRLGVCERESCCAHYNYTVVVYFLLYDSTALSLSLSRDDIFQRRQEISFHAKKNEKE